MENKIIELISLLSVENDSELIELLSQKLIQNSNTETTPLSFFQMDSYRQAFFFKHIKSIMNYFNIGNITLGFMEVSFDKDIYNKLLKTYQNIPISDIIDKRLEIREKYGRTIIELERVNRKHKGAPLAIDKCLSTLTVLRILESNKSLKKHLKIK